MPGRTRKLKEPKKNLFVYPPRYIFQTDAMTLKEFEKARTGHKNHLEALLASLDSPQSPQRLRSLTIHALRLLHLIETAQTAYITASRAVSRKDWGCYPIEGTLTEALDYKFNATYLSILDLLTTHNIPLDEWFFAQFHYLKQQRHPVTPFHCYGLPAFDRYQRWCKKQKRMYVRASESSNRLLPRDAAFTKVILDSHESALKWQSVLKDLKPPSLALALAYLWPLAVSGWYVLAHEEFRTTFLETGVVDDPKMLQCWAEWKRRPTLQALCQSALQHAIAEFGPLEF